MTICEIVIMHRIALAQGKGLEPVFLFYFGFGWDLGVIRKSHVDMYEQVVYLCIGIPSWIARLGYMACAWLAGATVWKT